MICVWQHTGAAMARDVPARGETAVEGAVKAGKAAQETLPKGATEYKTREDRNDSCVYRLFLLLQLKENWAILKPRCCEAGHVT
jgi:hypothetical protein